MDAICYLIHGRNIESTDGRGAEGRFVNNSAHHSRRMAGAPEGGTGETWRESCLVLRDLESFEALSLEGRGVMET